MCFGSSIPPQGVLGMAWLEAVNSKPIVTKPKVTGDDQCLPQGGAPMKAAKMMVLLERRRAPGQKHKVEDAGLKNMTTLS